MIKRTSMKKTILAFMVATVGINAAETTYECKDVGYIINRTGEIRHTDPVRFGTIGINKDRLKDGLTVYVNNVIARLQYVETNNKGVSWYASNNKRAYIGTDSSTGLPIWVIIDGEGTASMIDCIESKDK